jgi:hypothetical protein
MKELPKLEQEIHTSQKGKMASAQKQREKSSAHPEIKHFFLVSFMSSPFQLLLYFEAFPALAPFFYLGPSFGS